MVLFVGNPTNVVICEGFALNNLVFTAYTVLPFLACSLSCFIALAFQFRHAEYIPRRLDVFDDFDVRAALLDPVGAAVGGALLGACLIVMIIVSFFNVQVWMISLPFAISKFLWDLTWDTCKFRYSALDERSSLDDDDDDVMLRQLKRWNTHSTNYSESDLKQTLLEANSNAVANGENEGISLDDNDDNDNDDDDDDDAMPRNIRTTIYSESDLKQKLKVKKANANAVARGAANQHVDTVPNAVEPIRMLSPCDLQHRFSTYISIHFPTFHTALPRLPFALVPFAFSQFILIEGLSRQGWIDIFAQWLVILTKREMFKTIWVVGVLGVLLCNASGTNIGATILLTKIVNTAALSYVPPSSGPEVNIEAFLRSAAVALAVASNIGAVSFTFSASLTGLLWRQILVQKKIIVPQRTFAKWNLFPVVVMTVVGLAVVSGEMSVLYL